MAAQWRKFVAKEAILDLIQVYYLIMWCHGALRLFQGSTWLVDFSLKFDNTCKSDLVKILVLIWVRVFFCHNRNFFCSPLLKDGEIFWHKDLKNGTLHQQQHMLLWGAKNDYIIIIRVSQRRMDLGREFWLSVIKNTC